MSISPVFGWSMNSRQLLPAHFWRERDFADQRTWTHVRDEVPYLVSFRNPFEKALPFEEEVLDSFPDPLGTAFAKAISGAGALAFHQRNRTLRCSNAARSFSAECLTGKESLTRCLCSDSRVSFEDTHPRRVLSSKRASTSEKQAAAYALQIDKVAPNAHEGHGRYRGLRRATVKTVARPWLCLP